MPEDEKWILGILLLALKDLQNGFLAVGGQAAIGRGLFENNGAILIDGQEGLENQMIQESLKNMRVSGGKRHESDKSTGKGFNVCNIYR